MEYLHGTRYNLLNYFDGIIVNLWFLSQIFTLLFVFKNKIETKLNFIDIRLKCNGRIYFHNKHRATFMAGTPF